MKVYEVSIVYKKWPQNKYVDHDKIHNCIQAETIFRQASLDKQVFCG